MTAPGPGVYRALLCRAGGQLCALRLEDVVETMRPLDVEQLPGLPPFVRGLAVVRGTPIPVVDLRILLGAPEGRPPARFVTVRAGARRLALAVEEVLGVQPLPVSAQEDLPPLLGEVSAGAVETLGAADQQLLIVLRAARLVPEEIWSALADRGAGR